VTGDIIISFQFIYCLRPMLLPEKGRSIDADSQKLSCLRVVLLGYVTK
jgi:hypothetical protein